MNGDNIEDIYELSPAQQGILFHSLYSPNSGVYVVQQCYTLHGNLNIVAFEDAWQQVVTRHSALRTSFYWENLDKPVQVVHQQVKVPLEQYDWRGIEPAFQQEQLEAFLESDRKQGFDLSQESLIRLTLIRLSDDSYQFVWSKHHLILDGWSTALVLKDVVQRYEALCRGQNAPDTPSRPYGDYIAWLQQQDLSKAETFWRQVLSGIQAPTPLIKPNVDTPHSVEYDEQQVKLSPTTTAALQSVARQHQLTLSTLIQGAWAILLSRYSREEDVIYGSTVSGRPADLRGAESMVGLFINTLPVRVKVDANTALLPWLKQFQAQLVEMRQYEYSPLVEIQGWSEVPRGVPLFESIVVFENYPVDRVLRESKVNIEIQNVSAFERTNYPLTAIAIPGSELEFKISYDRNRFDCATITRMLGHFQTLLEGMANNPHSLLKDLPLLTQAEEHQLFVEWNDTQVESSHQKCIHQLFEEQVERTPDAVAVVTPVPCGKLAQQEASGSFGEQNLLPSASHLLPSVEDEQLTYQELNQRANQIAHYLRKLGVKPEVLVGICMERSPLMLVGLLGILKAGGAYVPIDPAYPRDRCCFMLEDAKVSVLLTESKWVASLPEYKGKVICLDADWEEIVRENLCNPTNVATPENLAYAIYTSGSTGQPKGVEILQGALVNFLNAMRLTPGLCQTDILLSVTTLSFDIAALELYLPLIVGARLVLVSREVAADGTQLLEQLMGSGATVMQATPATWRLLLAAGWQGKEQLKILCGGEALDAGLASELLERGKEVWNLYGPTETTIWSAVHKVEVCKNSDRKNSKIAIGRPIANTQFYVLDPQGKPVPVGVSGELHIGGAGVARGYLNRPELTAEKFIPNPFIDLGLGDSSHNPESCETDVQFSNPKSKIQNPKSSRLYKTGDLVRYLPDGNLEYLGRIDHQVKVRGFRIELGEIEAVLSQHPAVQETVVLAQEDAQGDKRLVAYGVTQQQLAWSDLRRFLIEKLPEYMVPSIFVPLTALPLTPNGKVDRRSLQVPDLTQLQSEVPFVAPSTPIEKMLAGIWEEVLGIEKIGIHDNFFELGGHSLLATRVISQSREVFEIELPLRRLFEKPTVAELAKDIETATQAGLGLESLPIKPIARDTELPLSFAQQRLWFLAHLEPDSPFYNIPGTFHLQGQLNIAALEQSLNEVLRRHEVLRTAFKTVEGRPVPVISSVTSLFLPVIDLSELPQPQQQAQVRQLAHQEAQQPFALDTSPLLRVKLLRLGEQEYVVLFTMHHIVSDGWSMGILVREIAALYQAFCNGQSSPLPELPIQYADFAAWQRQWLQGEVLETQLSYWRQQLCDAPALLELPLDHPRPAIQTFQGATCAFQLSQEVSVALKKLSQQEDSTVFMTLLAAFKTLLYRYTGSEDIVVGSPIANRNRSEIEGLIGFFVNTLVLRTNLSDSPTFRELLHRIRDVTLAAYTHQDLPFEQLVEVLQPQRSLSHTPLFQVMFVLQNAPMSEIELSGLTFSAIENNTGTAKFDLTLSMQETQEGLTGTFTYNTDLFEAATIERMAGHLQVLLKGVVANCDRQLHELPLLTATEKHQLLVEWNDTVAEYPQQKCIHQLFEEQVERSPNAIAVVFADQQLTYRELNDKANRIAHYLQKLGVGPEVLVGICVERSVDMVAGLLGILKAGGAYVPLDPSYPQGRLAFLLKDTQVPIVLTQKRLRATLPPNIAKIVYLDADENAINQEHPDNPISGVMIEHLAYVIYTSGSTGQPKGVMIDHRAICNRLLWGQSVYPLTETDRVLQQAAFSFDFSVWEIFAPLLTGAQLILVEPDRHRDSEYLVRLMAERQITTAHFVPVLLRVILEEPGIDRCTRLKRVFCGGEALSVELQERFFTRLTAQLYNQYGPTEASVDATFWHCQPSTQQSVVPIGRPIANTQIYLLDSHQQPVPIGVPGELCISGIGLARGYLNQPKLTADKFIPNPFIDFRLGDSSHNPKSSRLYRTGDLARYRPDGTIEFLGRIDNQVKVRGFRIELSEIEAVLTQHPAVRDAVVLVREDVPSSKRLVAYIVSHQSQFLSISDLHSFLHQQLPDYMLPSAFVLLDELPLTPTGKIDRQALPAPDTARPELQDSFVPPHTPIEETLAKIWAEVLKLEKVGVRDNFFELGGDSILSLQVIAKANQAGLQLTLKQLFEYPTIAKLATVAGTISTLNADQGIVSGSVPLTPIQHWFFEQDFPDRHHWNQAVMLSVQQPVDPILLEQVVRKLLEHHDALRLRFTEEDAESSRETCDAGHESPRAVNVQGFEASSQSKNGTLGIGRDLNPRPIPAPASPPPRVPASLKRQQSGWQAVNAAPVEETAPFVVVDLSTLPEAECGAAIEAKATTLQTSLNLSTGPLVRVALFQLGAKQPSRLLIIIHHLVIDGVSWRILLEDFQSAYQQLSQGQTMQLPPKTTSFRQFAQRLREYAPSEPDYWLSESRSLVSPLPMDWPGGNNTVASTRTVSVSLSREETQFLLKDVPAAYQTQINDALLTALIKTFRQWTGESSLLIDLEGHGREGFTENLDLSRTVGWFTIIFPVLLTLEETFSPGEALKTIKEQLRRIPDQGMGYGVLRYLGRNQEITSQLHALPQAEVKFNYLGQFDSVLSESSLFRAASEACGLNRSERGNRTHLLEINGMTIEGQMRLDWNYSAAIHRQDTVERLASGFIEALRSLITHCQSPDAGGYTPSDFPQMRFSQKVLDQLMAKLSQSEEE